MDDQDRIEQEATPVAEAIPETSGLPGSGEAWREVLSQLDELGRAVATWAKAAVDDPENRRRAAELKERFDGVGRELGEAVDRAASSDVGQSFKEAAEKTGEAFKVAGERFSGQVAPKVAEALRRAADSMGDASERMRERAAGAEDTQTAETPAPPAAEREDPSA
ncbi:MAG: hypothetical protein C0418_05315 [Coriobacteriaceae bacterium]|nr:hypothetical protein [Coriobacteriaceae bacterium]